MRNDGDGDLPETAVGDEPLPVFAAADARLDEEHLSRLQGQLDPSDERLGIVPSKGGRRSVEIIGVSQASIEAASGISIFLEEAPSQILDSEDDENFFP